mgnify:CR=1 FL=1
MLALGLVVGSTKGDDLIEKIQGVETVEYQLDNHEELAARFNTDMRHRLAPTTPKRLHGSKLESHMIIMNDRYHFDFSIAGEKVAELEYDKDENFLGGGWIVE